MSYRMCCQLKWKMIKTKLDQTLKSLWQKKNRITLFQISSWRKSYFSQKIPKFDVLKNKDKLFFRVTRDKLLKTLWTISKSVRLIEYEDVGIHSKIGHNIKSDKNLIIKLITLYHVVIWRLNSNSEYLHERYSVNCTCHRIQIIWSWVNRHRDIWSSRSYSHEMRNWISNWN